METEVNNSNERGVSVTNGLLNGQRQIKGACAFDHMLTFRFNLTELFFTETKKIDIHQYHK